MLLLLLLIDRVLRVLANEHHDTALDGVLTLLVHYFPSDLNIESILL